MPLTNEQLEKLISDLSQATGNRFAAVDARLAAAGIPTAIDGPTALDKLDGVMLDAGKAYKLAPGNHTITGTVVMPAKATLDVTGSTITYQSTAKYGIAVMFNGSGATLRGGTWVAGNATPLDAKKPEQDTFANSQRVWDIASTATDILVENVTLASDDVAHEWNSGYTGYNSVRATFRNIACARVYGYLIWTYGATDMLVEDCKVTVGSTKETPLRFHAIKRLVVRNCQITNTLYKVGGIRIHEGEDALVEGCTFYAIAQCGPMGGGDGGEQWGVSWWVTSKGNSTQDIKAADLAATVEKRRSQLAVRLKNITWRNNTITGIFAVDAGIEGTALVEGGSLAPFPGHVGKDDVLAQPFNRMGLTYPLKPLPTDIVRPTSPFTFRGVEFKGTADPRRWVPASWKFEGCTWNGAKLQ